MPPIPFALRVFLFLIHLFAFNPEKPLPKTRKITNWFMGFVNRRLAIRTPDFFKEEDLQFTAKAGHTIKTRVFIPFKTTEKLPVWMYFHGGGFAHGTYKSRSNFCKAIASRAHCIVVSVEYRLAPEHPFPAAIEDCYEATCWVWQHGGNFGADAGQMAVGGESAGGNLAAAVSLMARDRGAPAILHQTLLYPTVDAHMNFDSIEKFGEGYMLTKKLVHQFRMAYAPDPQSWNNPYLSPLLADLKNLPPALVITAGYDPLVDEGDLYAEKLKQAGVAVKHLRYDNMIHDFIMLLMRTLPEASESVDAIVLSVRQVWGKSPKDPWELKKENKRSY